MVGLLWRLCYHWTFDSLERDIGYGDNLNYTLYGWVAMIDLPEGLYDVDQAYLVDENRNRLPLRNASFEIWLDKQGQKQLRGRGFIRNLHFAQMLEDTDEVDVVLCFFEDYYLWLKEPVIQVGKVFEPDTESSMIFSIGEQVSLISEDQFSDLTGL
jgi:hypothetical protein